MVGHFGMKKTIFTVYWKHCISPLETGEKQCLEHTGITEKLV